MGDKRTEPRKAEASRSQPDVSSVGIRPQDLFAGGGEMGALMRATDWSKTEARPRRTLAEKSQDHARRRARQPVPDVALVGPRPAAPLQRRLPPHPEGQAPRVACRSGRARSGPRSGTSPGPWRGASRREGQRPGRRTSSCSSTAEGWPRRPTSRSRTARSRETTDGSAACSTRCRRRPRRCRANARSGCCTIWPRARPTRNPRTRRIASRRRSCPTNELDLPFVLLYVAERGGGRRTARRRRADGRTTRAPPRPLACPSREERERGSLAARRGHSNRSRGRRRRPLRRASGRCRPVAGTRVPNERSSCRCSAPASRRPTRSWSRASARTARSTTGTEASSGRPPIR